MNLLLHMMATRFRMTNSLRAHWIWTKISLTVFAKVLLANIDYSQCHKLDKDQLPSLISGILFCHFYLLMIKSLLHLPKKPIPTMSSLFSIPTSPNETWKTSSPASLHQSLLHLLKKLTPITSPIFSIAMLQEQITNIFDLIILCQVASNNN